MAKHSYKHKQLFRIFFTSHIIGASTHQYTDRDRERVGLTLAFTHIDTYRLHVAILPPHAHISNNTNSITQLMAWVVCALAYIETMMKPHDWEREREWVHERDSIVKRPSRTYEHTIHTDGRTDVWTYIHSESIGFIDWADRPESNQRNVTSALFETVSYVRLSLPFSCSRLFRSLRSFVRSHSQSNRDLSIYCRLIWLNACNLYISIWP